FEFADSKHTLVDRPLELGHLTWRQRLGVQNALDSVVPACDRTARDLGNASQQVRIRTSPVSMPRNLGHEPTTLAFVVIEDRPGAVHEHAHGQAYGAPCRTPGPVADDDCRRADRLCKVELDPWIAVCERVHSEWMSPVGLDDPSQPGGTVCIGIVTACLHIGDGCLQPRTCTVHKTDGMNVQACFARKLDSHGLDGQTALDVQLGRIGSVEPEGLKPRLVKTVGLRDDGIDFGHMRSLRGGGSTITNAHTAAWRTFASLVLPVRPGQDPPGPNR